MLDAKVTRFPFIFFNLSGFRISLATTSPLMGAIYVVSFLRKRCVKRGNIVAEAKMFLNLFRTILPLQQMFPRLRVKEKYRETMFPYTTFPRFWEPNQGQSV